MLSRTFIANARRKARLSRIIGLFCAFAMASIPIHAVTLRLDGERLWLTAQDVSLHDVLRQFAHLGVHVHLDPAANKTITHRAIDEDIERALAAILDPFGYVLIWDMVDHPSGRQPQLSGIQVFRPGYRDAMQPLEDTLGWVIRRAPDGRTEYVADEILIGFAPGADQDAIRRLIRELGGTVVGSVGELGIYRIRFPPNTNVLALVAQLKDHPVVSAVEPNYVYRITPPARDTAGSTPSVSTAWTRLPTPPEGATRVAVLDSGWSPRPEWDGWVKGAFNALNPDLTAQDDAGHGTQMALIASGAIAPGAATPGPGAPVLAIRSFDDQGATSNYAVMRSLLHAAEQGATVVNMSWGTHIDSGFLSHAAQAAARDGLLLIASAGNEPSNEPVYPAAYDAVLGIGAALPDGSPWPQSNYGPFVFMLAPGTATFPVGYQGEPGAYAGTSIASAYTAYVAGKYRAQNPEARPGEVVAAFREAVARSNTDRDDGHGYGILDEEAVRRLLQ